MRKQPTKNIKQYSNHLSLASIALFLFCNVAEAQQTPPNTPITIMNTTTYSIHQFTFVIGDNNSGDTYETNLLPGEQETLNPCLGNTISNVCPLIHFSWSRNNNTDNFYTCVIPPHLLKPGISGTLTIQVFDRDDCGFVFTRQY